MSADQSLDADNRTPQVNAGAIKAVVLRAWRERWSDEMWSIGVKPYLASTSRLNYSLADVLLEQSVFGSTPNAQLLSYLKYAINTQMVTVSAAINRLVKFVDINRTYCIQSLVLLVDTLLQSISSCEDSLSLSRSFLSLLLWLLELLQRLLQQLNTDTLSTSSVTLATLICEAIVHISENNPARALVHVALADVSDQQQQFDQLIVAIQNCTSKIVHNQAVPDATTELKVKVAEVVKYQSSFRELSLPTRPLLDTSTQMLNISINVLVSTEAVLRPTNDIQPLVSELLLLESMQGISRPRLYCELLRGCFMGIIDAVGKPDEFKWAAFTYLKLPNILQRLVQTGQIGMQGGAASVNMASKLQQLEEGLDQLLQYIPLLDMADTKCSCDCLQFLLHELCSKYALVTETQRQKILNKRSDSKRNLLEFLPYAVLHWLKLGQSLKSKATDSPNTTLTASLILRAEPTVASILKTLDADYSKNQEALLGILCQMMSGKSFELILSAAAATGKLQVFAMKLIKFNEFAKQTLTGETTKSAQTRALLFDISFLMLCHIAQLYGTEVIVSCPDSSTTLFVQWIVQCLPEDGKYKSVDLINPPDQIKVDILLGQFNPPGSELKTQMTRWNEVCHNAPYAIQEVLWAWECGNLQHDNIKSIMDAVKGTMCCLPVVVSAWLCCHISISDSEIRQKAIYMLQQLLLPLPSSPDQTNQLADYTERSILMQVILSKMVHDLLPIESIPRPFAFTLPSKIPTNDMLVDTYRQVMRKGHICIDDIQKLDYLLNVGGSHWFSEHLVREVLTYDRPEDLTKGVGLLYSLFHIDIESITLCLIHYTLPTLIQSTGSSLRLLTDPRGSALAKLCVMCLAVVHKMRLKTKGGEASGVPRTRKRMRADIHFEMDEDFHDDERLCKKRRSLGGEDGDTTVDSDDDSLLNNDSFALRDFLCTTPKEKDPTEGGALQYDSKNLLNRSLMNLFRLFSAVLADKLINPRTGFVLEFISETLKTGTATTRFILQFLPINMINQLIKIMPGEITADVLLHFCDLTTAAGRKAATKVICLNSRHLLATHSGTFSVPLSAESPADSRRALDVK